MNGNWNACWNGNASFENDTGNDGSDDRNCKMSATDKRQAEREREKMRKFMNEPTSSST